MQSVVTQDVWAGEIQVDRSAFMRILRETAETMVESGIPHLFIGGMASTALGRPRWTHDIDVFVRPEDALATLHSLAAAGFRTQETDPRWLFKATKAFVLVDVIFRSRGGIELDGEMLRRCRPVSFFGVRLPLVSPEDLIVIKALANSERAPRHWHDALALLSRNDIDWKYMVKRAVRHDPDRLLSLLSYARSEGILAPGSAIEALLDSIRTPA